MISGGIAANPLAQEIRRLENLKKVPQGAAR